MPVVSCNPISLKASPTPQNKDGKEKASTAKQTLSSVIERFDLIKKEGILVTDDGVENKGALQKWLGTPEMQWKQLIAQIDIIQSNSMVEAVNKILKYRYLYINPVNDTEELKRILEAAVENHNNIPSARLFGLTPNEVLNGAVSDKNFFQRPFCFR